MDHERLIRIYNALPELRMKVLHQMLLGKRKKTIADELRIYSIDAVTAHFKEIYKAFKVFLEGADPESKRAEIVRVFYSEAPLLVARIRIQYRSTVPLGDKPIQFGPAIEKINEYKFELSKVRTDEIPSLQLFGRKYFKAENHLPTELIESWHEVDTNSIRKMTNLNGRLNGFFIILFLKSDYLIEFLNGRLKEACFTQAAILSDKWIPTMHESCVYISVVVGETGHSISNICIILLLAKYIDLIRMHRRVSMLCATSATESGKSLLVDHLGFRLLSAAEDRIDKDDLYATEIVDDNVPLFSLLIERYPAFQHCSHNLDLSNQCSWAPIYPKPTH